MHKGNRILLQSHKLRVSLTDDGRKVLRIRSITKHRIQGAQTIAQKSELICTRRLPRVAFLLGRTKKAQTSASGGDNGYRKARRRIDRHRSMARLCPRGRLPAKKLRSLLSAGVSPALQFLSRQFSPPTPRGTMCHLISAITLLFPIKKNLRRDGGAREERR